MAFDFNEIVNRNYEKVLMSYLGVKSLENYDVKVESYSLCDREAFYEKYLELSFKIILNKNHFSAIVTYRNEKSSLYSQQIQSKYLDNTSIMATFEDFKKANLRAETERYILNVSNKVETIGNTNLKILLKIIKFEMYSLPYQFKRDYLLIHYKEKVELLNREDAMYKRIEAFQTFEHTYRIFYEIAIRNNCAKKIINSLDYLYDIKQIKKNTLVQIDEISCEKNNDEKIYKIFGTVNGDVISDKIKLFITLNNSKCQYIESVVDNCYEINIFQNNSTDKFDLNIAVGEENYQDNRMNFRLPRENITVSVQNTTTGIAKTNKIVNITVITDKGKFTPEIEEDGNWTLNFDDKTEIINENSFLKKYSNFLSQEDNKIYLSTNSHTILELIDEFETELKEQYLIYYENSNVKHSEKNHILVRKAAINSVATYKVQNIQRYDNMIKYFAREGEYSGYTVYQGILNDDDGEFDLSIIKQDMTKKVVDKNLSTIEFNLNLPKAELIAYLSKIKDNYDNDNSMLKLPWELLEKSFEVNVDINLGSGSIPKRLKTKLTEIADMFFTYDINPFILQRKKALEDEIKVLKIKRDELKSEKTYKLNPDRNVGKPNITPTYRSIKVEYETLIDDCKKNIKRLEEDVKKNNNLIATEIGETADTVKTYNDIMSDYIENKKYIKFLTKT
jgi:hypothetical protein